jgi:hypothetical protein
MPHNSLPPMHITCWVRDYGRTALAYTLRLRVYHVAQYVCANFHVVFRHEQYCLSPQPHVQPSGWHISGGVPITLLTGLIPDVSLFRVLDRAAFAKVPDTRRHKLDPKSFRGVFVGYPYKSPGYRIYNPTTRRITTSIHTVFQEHIPGFSTSSTPSPSHVSLEHVAFDAPPDRPSRDRRPPPHLSVYVANVSTVPLARVTQCCDPGMHPDPSDTLSLLSLDYLSSLAPPIVAPAWPQVAFLSVKECP